MPKCLDGKYFAVKKWKTEINIEVECQLCSNKKTICAAVNGTSNLFRHMKQNHLTEIDAFYVHIGQSKSSTGDGKKQTKLTDTSLTNEKVIRLSLDAIF